MRRRKRTQPTPRPLELSFASLFLRLNSDERRRVADELQRPFRRQWFIVDGAGVRRLED